MKPRTIKCQKCGYEWEYKGLGYYAQCYRCRGFTKCPPIEEKEEIRNER